MELWITICEIDNFIDIRPFLQSKERQDVGHLWIIYSRIAKNVGHINEFTQTHMPKMSLDCDDNMEHLTNFVK